MAYRNIKVDFEYKGTTYAGIAVEDGVTMGLGVTKVDGFPPLTTFGNCAPEFPTFNPGGIASVSKNAGATAGYYVLDAL